MNVPASEESGSDQVLEDSEDRSSVERLQHSRLEGSEDQVPKNPEDQKFC